MARDYAKRRPARRILTAGVSTRGKKSGGSRRSGVAKHLPYLLVGVMMGLLIAGFFYLKMQPLQVAHEDVSDEDIPTQVTKVKKAKVAHHKKAATTVAHNNTQPHYDFYTMLTKEKDSENAPAEDTTADEESNGDEDTPVKSKVTTEQKDQKEDQEDKDEPVQLQQKREAVAAGKYVLQIASLKKQQDADRLKARLTLEGYDVFINKQKIKNTVYYRVQVGPYQTAANAKCQQRRLQKCNIRSLLISA